MQTKLQTSEWLVAMAGLVLAILGIVYCVYDSVLGAVGKPVTSFWFAIPTLVVATAILALLALYTNDVWLCYLAGQRVGWGEFEFGASVLIAFLVTLAAGLARWIAWPEEVLPLLWTFGFVGLFNIVLGLFVIFRLDKAEGSRWRELTATEKEVENSGWQAIKAGFFTGVMGLVVLLVSAVLGINNVPVRSTQFTSTMVFEATCVTILAYALAHDMHVCNRGRRTSFVENVADEGLLRNVNACLTLCLLTLVAIWLAPENLQTYLWVLGWVPFVNIVWGCWAIVRWSNTESPSQMEQSYA